MENFTMRVALFLKSDEINIDNIDVIPIIILHIGHNTIMEVEKEIILKKDINYLSLWLLTKHIKEIYVMDIDPVIKKLFEKLDIIVRKHEDLEKNPVLKEFIR